MKISNLNGVRFELTDSQGGNDRDMIARVPLGLVDVGDSIIHNTTDNIRKIVDIVPDAVNPAYVKMHFEDGGAMTMSTKSQVILPSSYKMGWEPSKVAEEEGGGQYTRTLEHGKSYDSARATPELKERMRNEGVVFHGVPLTESNPWLVENSAGRDRSGAFHTERQTHNG